MQIRTDLALEQKEMCRGLPSGVESEETKKGDALITKITVKNSDGAKALGKPVGIYTTIEVPPFSDNLRDVELTFAVADELIGLLPSKGDVLVVGLGNRNITPDALGPKAVEGILATRHISQEIRRVAGIEDIRTVSVIAPGVLGQTGIEVFNLLEGIVGEIKPACIIAIDALASRYLKRLGCTVQMCDSGIEPGAGVGNARHEISEKTLGVKVIAIGVPTVTDAATLVYDLAGKTPDTVEPDGRQMIITPREVDLLIDRAAGLIADAVNKALHPNTPQNLINELLA